MEHVYPGFARTAELKRLFDSYFAYAHVNDAVYSTLLEAIRIHMFPPGLHLSSTKLASVLDISRTPVQIALVRLECAGLIRADQNHRYITYELSFQEGRDYNEYMLGLYLFSFRLAFKKGVDTYYCNLLEKRLDQLDREPNVSNYLEAENDFHRIIVQSTNNKELLEAFDRISQKGFVMNLAYKDEEMVPDFIKNHQPLNRCLVQTILGNDILALDEATEKHNEFMMRNVCNWISEEPF